MRICKKVEVEVERNLYNVVENKGGGPTEKQNLVNHFLEIPFQLL